MIKPVTEMSVEQRAVIIISSWSGLVTVEGAGLSLSDSISVTTEEREKIH